MTARIKSSVPDRSLLYGGLLKQAVVGVALLSLTACTTISDWFADEEELKIRRIPDIQNQFTPKVEWDYSVGDGVNDFYSRLRPVYANDTVFVAERHGEVAALAPDTGNVKWRRNFAFFPNETFWDGIAKMWRSGTSAKLSAVAAAYDILYVTSEDGLVRALNVDTGETLWEISVAGEILAAPAADSGILVVNTGAGVLFGLNAKSGEQLWRSETDVPPLSLRGISGPAASNGGALVGTPTGKLQVNILESGIPAWETAITAPSGATELERIIDVDSTPVVFGATVYIVSYDGTLAALELRSGRIIWKREYASYRDLAVSGNRIYVVDKRSIIYALDRRNGVELWSQGGLKERNLTAPLVSDNYIVVGDKWGLLHWIDQEDGKLVARYDLGGDDEDDAIYAAPIQVNDMVLTITRDGDVAALSVQ